MEISSTGSSPLPSVQSQQTSPPQQSVQQQEQAQQTAELEVALTTPEPDQRAGTVIDTQA